VTGDRSESGTFNFNPYSNGDERDKVKGETQFGWRRTLICFSIPLIPFIPVNRF
jgi:hypothetical protein